MERRLGGTGACTNTNSAQHQQHHSFHCLFASSREPFPLLGSSKMQHILQKNSVFPGAKHQTLFENKDISNFKNICKNQDPYFCLARVNTWVCAHQQAPLLFWSQCWPMDRRSHFGRRTSELWFPYDPSSWLHLGSTDMAEKKPVPHSTPSSGSVEQRMITNQKLIKWKQSLEMEK